MSPPIRKQVVCALFDPAHRKPTPNRLSKKSLPSPLGPPPPSLLPFYTNSHRQQSRMQTHRNTPLSTRTKNTLKTPALPPVNRLIKFLHTFHRVGYHWRGV